MPKTPVFGERMDCDGVLRSPREWTLRRFFFLSRESTCADTSASFYTSTVHDALPVCPRHADSQIFVCEQPPLPRATQSHSPLSCVCPFTSSRAFAPEFLSYLLIHTSPKFQTWVARFARIFSKGQRMAAVRVAVTAVGLVWLAATGSADVRADLEVIKLFSKTGEGSLTLMYSDFSANIMANGGHNKSAVPPLPQPSLPVPNHHLV